MAAGDCNTEKTDIAGCLVDEASFQDIVSRICTLESTPAVDFCDSTALLESDNNESEGSWSRAGNVGTSEFAARCDHQHPIVRIPNPGDPTITYNNHAGSSIVAQLILDRHSTEEWYAYKFRIQISNMNAGNGWAILTIPTIAGFQQPYITGVGSYRNGSGMPQNDDAGGTGGTGAAPRGPYMGKEWNHWSSTNRLYFGYYRRDNTLGNQYVEFHVKYIRL